MSDNIHLPENANRPLKKGEKYVVAVNGIEVELSAEKQANLAKQNVAEQDITLGVRPPHISLSNENAITAKVDVSEMMGSEVHLHVNADGKDVVIIVPTMDLEGDTKSTFAYGAEIKFTFAGHVCHVFDKDGKNLEF